MKIRHLSLVSILLLATAPAFADTFGTGANQFTIDFVTIGDPGNLPDTTGDPNPAGSVPYVYRIGKYEISRDMIEKASAEGVLGIALADMSFVVGGARSNMPATEVSWNEAALRELAQHQPRLSGRLQVHHAAGRSWLQCQREQY